MMKAKIIYCLSFFMSFLACPTTHAQYIRISGTVTDAVTGKPIRSCSVRAVNVRRGAITDSAGQYLFVTEQTIDSIRVSIMGYETITKPVVSKKTQVIDFSLIQSANTLNEVFVYPKGYDPAVHLFKKIIQHKGQNNPDRFSNIHYEVYDKMELDVNKISDKTQKSRLLKPFAFVFKNVDSSNTASPYLPVFLTESIADYYYNRQLKKEKTIYKAKQISGIKNESVIGYLDNLKQQVNVYDNYPILFKVTFISPLADNGLSYYKYAIEERKTVNGRKYFRMGFHPLHSGSNTFTGDFWVIDKTYAIATINMQADKSANINWVSNMGLSQDFVFVNDSLMALSKNELTVEFTTLSGKTLGFIGRKSSYFRNISINNSLTDSVLYNNTPQLKELTQKGDLFWDNNRFVPLTQKEQWVYTMVDSIKKVPAFSTYSKVITALGTGYYPVGKIDIGNIYKMVTTNPIEGRRVNMALRTNGKFSNFMQLQGYIGMGIKDQEPRYAVSSLFVLNRKNWETVKLVYQKDFMHLSNHFNELNENSIFGSIMRRIPDNQVKLVDNEQLSIQYRKYYSNGFSVQLAADRSMLSPAFNTYFTYNEFKPILIDIPNPAPKEYRVTEASVAIRYAYKEKYLTNQFGRVCIGSKYPVVELKYSGGLQIANGFLKSDFRYNKLNLSVSQHFNINPFGKINYSINGGITDGTLPILLLDVAKGNDTYYYNKYAFNNMNRYEFAGDHFISLAVEHEWGSFPYNHIPLIKKLKWRSVTTFRALKGSMTPANKTANGYYDNTISYHFIVPDKAPYMELGYGIENIFHILRIDGIWRLNYLDKPGTPKFGIRASLQFAF